VDIIMWFKHLKYLKEPEINSLRLTLGHYQLFIWEDTDDAVNHTERGSFVEAFLAEPRIMLIDLNDLRRQIEEDQEEDKWRKLDYVN